MKSFLDVEGGLFDPSKRFAFTNITSEDFVSAWDGSPIIVKPGDTVELQHHLAVKLTGELVDKIMIGNAKMDEVQKNQPYYRSPQGSALGVPAARKVWEDQILRELAVDEESPEIQVLRAQIRQEILSDQKGEASTTPPPTPSISDFSEIKTDKMEAPKVEKKPLRMRKVKISA